MQKYDLEKHLRSFEVLRGISVEYPSEIASQIAPWIVALRGIVNIKGEPHMFEAEINLNEFNSYDDVLRLAKAILVSFEKAERNGS